MLAARGGATDFLGSTEADQHCPILPCSTTHTWHTPSAAPSRIATQSVGQWVAGLAALSMAGLAGVNRRSFIACFATTSDSRDHRLKLQGSQCRPYLPILQ